MNTELIKLIIAKQTELEMTNAKFAYMLGLKLRTYMNIKNGSVKLLKPQTNAILEKLNIQLSIKSINI